MERLSFRRSREEMPGHGAKKKRYFQRKDDTIQILQGGVKEKD